MTMLEQLWIAEKKILYEEMSAPKAKIRVIKGFFVGLWQVGKGSSNHFVPIVASVKCKFVLN
ncbi:hypothetical protein EDC32_101302 [Laceyella sacchari]|uniref:hypothetical protein n=1 Tax=Laceyella sacchari TaxID=37482 RepID=UPI001051806B|nr:hypothetical protein [Laceyella sacchari]TCW40656.1 hypothetical protein EDC32_101302 [Laceyella sacchari]